jgi:hypothetical protein
MVKLDRRFLEKVERIGTWAGHFQSILGLGLLVMTAAGTIATALWNLPNGHILRTLSPLMLGILGAILLEVHRRLRAANAQPKPQPEPEPEPEPARSQSSVSSDGLPWAFLLVDDAVASTPRPICPKCNHEIRVDKRDGDGLIYCDVPPCDFRVAIEGDGQEIRDRARRKIDRVFPSA